MTRWLPRFYVSSNLLCLDDGEMEGPVVGVSWGCLVFEVHVLRRTRQL